MVNDKIHERLAKLGSYGDSMSDIIGRLLDEHESHKGQGQKKEEVVAN
jgi:predicted CopG family antitoxin